MEYLVAPSRLRPFGPTLPQKSSTTAQLSRGCIIGEMIPVAPMLSTSVACSAGSSRPAPALEQYKIELEFDFTAAN